MKAYCLLVLLCLAFYLPGISTLPPVDRDEARFAQASGQMLESGDFVQIRFQDEPRNKKPIGVYWLQAASAYLFGAAESRSIWPYRVPSVLGAVASVLLAFSLGARLFGPRVGLLGAAFLASSLLLVAEAHLAKTDALLLATIVASQWALSRLYLRENAEKPPPAPVVLAFWVAQAVGILIKGPLTPLASLLTIGCLVAADRDVKWLKDLRPIAGIALVIIIASPWAIAIALATKGAFFQQALGGDLLSKVASGKESHGFPPGFYLLLMPLTLWPASPVAGAALFRAWKLRSSSAVRFCLACIAPLWVLFELIPTKLPHYVLPTYPAICLLAALFVCGGRTDGVFAGEGREGLPPDAQAPFPETHPKYVRVGYISCFLVILLCGFGVLAPRWLLDGRYDPVGLIPAAAAVATTALAVKQYLSARYVHAAAVAIAGTALVLGPTFQWVVPNVDAFWLSRTVADAVKERAHGDPPLAAVGYHEPSLVFLLGTRTLLTHPAQAALFLRDNPKGMVLTGGKEDEAFRKEMENLGLQAKLVGSFRGFNYSKGKKMVLRLYVVATEPPGAGEG